MRKEINLLNNELEYLIIQNKVTGEIIAKITQYNTELINDYVIRIKEKDKTEV